MVPYHRAVDLEKMAPYYHVEDFEQICVFHHVVNFKEWHPTTEWWIFKKWRQNSNLSTFSIVLSFIFSVQCDQPVLAKFFHF